MDYAIIASGGKQHKVQVGQRTKLEKLNLFEGDELSFDKVLMIKTGDQPALIGKPYVEGASVGAKVVRQGRGKKIRIIHFKRRKHHLKRMGHRQDFTEVLISSLNLSTSTK